MTHKPCLTLLVLSLLALGLARNASAQVRTDGSTNGRPTSLQGPDYRIDPSLGRLSGNNLFHSFETFQLGRGESATFSTQSLPVAQVISRVTGGAASNINGVLRLDAGNTQPGFWFINPAGVVFGEGASIEVPGAFHASTAAQLRFSDGARWDTGSASSSFVSAAPEAFGFLGPAASLRLQGALLQGAPGQALQLVAGDISINGGLIDASGGLRLVATGTQALDVPLQGSVTGMPNGDVSISNVALVRVSTSGALDAGALSIEAGSLRMDGGAGLRSRAGLNTSGKGGDIQLRLGASLTMDGGSFVESLTGTAAPGGRVSLQAGTASLASDSYFWSYTLASGIAGGMDLLLGQSLLLDSGANLYSSTSGSGAGADLRVRAPLIALSNGAFLTSDASSSGRSGAIDVEASQLLQLRGAELVGLLVGSGDGGDIRLASQDLFLLDGGSRISVSAAGSGQTGQLSLSARSLRLTEGTAVRHSAEGLGSTGETLLSGSTLLRMDGGAQVVATSEGRRTGAIRLTGGELYLGSGSFLLNSAQQPGSVAGDLSLSASGLLTLDGASLFNLGTGGGSAGNVQLQARDLVVGGASRLISSSSDAGSAAGNLLLSASRSLLVNTDATLNTATFSERNAGSIRLTAPAIQLDRANLSSSSFGIGNAGAIELQANGGLLQIGGDSVLQSASQGSGNAGSLQMTAEDIRIGKSLIFASVGEDSTGSGGDIRVQATRNLDLLVGSAVDTSTLNGNGNAGQLLFSAGGALRLEGARLSSFAGPLAAGNAGAITLQSRGTLSIGGQSAVATATLGAGNAGRIRMEAPSLSLSDVDVSSDALVGARGEAGRIELVAQRLLDVGAGSRLSSSTSGSGAAGSLLLQSGDELVVRGGAQLGAVAFPGSGGQTGNIDVQAGSLIRITEISNLQITNGATVANPSALRPTLLRLEAPRIEISQALLAASALGNANASRIELLAGDQLLITESAVTTGAQDGNGGALTARAGGLLRLRNAGLITSVFGQNGNGGDIEVSADLLFLDGGFIQANTAAANASGGDVRINTRALVASNNRVIIGGDVPLVFDRLRPLNVIQAAAPTGVSGAVAVNNTLDIAGSLALLDRKLLDPGRLGRSPCERPGGSALALSGRGGLPPPAAALLGAPQGARQSLPNQAVACR